VWLAFPLGSNKVAYNLIESEYNMSQPTKLTASQQVLLDMSNDEKSKNSDGFYSQKGVDGLTPLDEVAEFKSRDFSVGDIFSVYLDCADEIVIPNINKAIRELFNVTKLSVKGESSNFVHTDSNGRKYRAIRLASHIEK